jgi:hypothetical protein
VTGDVHSDYAESLSQFGAPLRLPKSGGWLPKRLVDAIRTDAMGTYRLFAYSDWKSLKTDFNLLGKSLVSVVVVTDSFGEYNEPLLRDGFGDLVTPFKAHFGNDLSRPLESTLRKHHERNAGIGLKQFVELCEGPSSYLDDWARLYSVLIQRHQICGIRAFSRNSFSRQLRPSLPETVQTTSSRPYTRRKPASAEGR